MGGGGKIPYVPQGSLVSRRRLVRSARELEGQYRYYRRGDAWNSRCGLEHQCRTRIPGQDARAGQVLPKSILEQADYRTRKATGRQKRIIRTCGKTKKAAGEAMVWQGLCSIIMRAVRQ
ncbi:hypothetical protein BDV09DRAFT_189093 [Aspergillus tetrazonus]